MTMSTGERPVRDLIALYVGGSVSMDELAAGLPDGWELDEADDSALARLVLRVVGMISEVQAGDRPEPLLKSDLEPEASWVAMRSTDTQTAILDRRTAATAEYAAVGTPRLTALASYRRPG